MNTNLSRRAALAAIGGAAVLTGAESQSTVRFRETGDNFVNPHRGLMTPQRGPDRRTPRFPTSVVYVRVAWADLEPEEGKYDWSIFDAPIAAWKPLGARISFRIMTTNAHSRGYYTSPKWLFDAGCKSFDYLRGGSDPTSGGARINRIEPDYSDPLFLARHSNFLRAVAERYDQHPGMEFADIGSYGIWGEWHTQHPAPFEVRKQIIDMYADNFHTLPLVFMSDDAEGLNYALSRGTGFRRDGVGSAWHAQTWFGSAKYAKVAGFETAWRRAPVVFEWYGDWKYLKGRGWSFTDSVRFMLDNHVTYINDNIGAVPDEDMPLLADLERRAGYRYVLREVSHAATVRRGAALAAKMKWSNVGAARIYREYPLELSLAAPDGRTAVRVQAADTRQWLPGDHEIDARLPVPGGLAPGEYVLRAALVDRQGTPSIRLACDAPHERLSYRLGGIHVA